MHAAIQSSLSIITAFTTGMSFLLFASNCVIHFIVYLTAKDIYFNTSALLVKPLRARLWQLINFNCCISCCHQICLHNCFRDIAVYVRGIISKSMSRIVFIFFLHSLISIGKIVWLRTPAICYCYDEFINWENWKNLCWMLAVPKLYLWPQGDSTGKETNGLFIGCFILHEMYHFVPWHELAPCTLPRPTPKFQIHHHMCYIFYECSDANVSLFSFASNHGRQVNYKSTTMW